MPHKYSGPSQKDLTALRRRIPSRMTFFSRALRVGILASALMMLNCQQLMDLLDEANKTDTTSANANTDLDKTGSWTVLVYLDADNNLEGAGVGDVTEMINAGNLNGNKTYVLMDRSGGFDNTNTNVGLPAAAGFTGAILFKVVNGVITSLAPTAQTVPYTTMVNWVQNTGVGGAADEVNMGDRKTLENFIIFGLKQAIADGTDYVYLDIWDHGAGWGGGAYGGNAVAWDDTDGHDALSIDEIRTAIANAYAAVPNKKITIIGFDACYMGTMENAYSFKDYASIMIGSEEVEPGNGWAYDVWLPNGKVSPRTVATNVVTSFKTSYNGGGEQVTLAAYDLSKIAGVSTALESFLTKISGQSSTAISGARQQSQSYNNDMSVDLYDFVDKMNMPESAALKNMIKSLMVAEAHTAGGKVDRSYGVTVFFPQSSSNYDTTYNNTVFAQSTKWDEFISGKLASFEVNSTEPGDATCGSESNDSATKANKPTAGTLGSCTGYVYTPSDVDIYNFRMINMTNTGTELLTVTLSNIPSGADFDVLLFNTDVSPSAPIAAGVITGGGNESFSLHTGTGVVDYAAGSCVPTNSNNALYKQGLCYGAGVFGTTGANSNKFYLVIVGKNNSYNQVGKYTLSVSASGGAAAIQQAP